MYLLHPCDRTVSRRVEPFGVSVLERECEPAWSPSRTVVNHTNVELQPTGSICVSNSRRLSLPCQSFTDSSYATRMRSGGGVPS